MHVPVRHKANTKYALPGVWYAAVLYLRQPMSRCQFPATIPCSRQKSTTAVCTSTLTVIRACGFLEINQSFNPSTSSTYVVSLRTRELICSYYWSHHDCCIPGMSHYKYHVYAVQVLYVFFLVCLISAIFCTKDEGTASGFHRTTPDEKGAYPTDART